VTDPALSARNKRNKRKGADFEIALEKGLREELGFDIERLRLKGVEDEGDLVVRDDDGGYLIIEAKDAAFQPGTFISEAEREAANYAKHRNLDPDLVEKVVIVKRRGKGWKQAFVLTTVEDYFGLDLEP
jgi:hypothetical protein